MSVDACAEIVRAGDPDRFRTVLASPREVRARLLVLYAFNLEIARAPWVTQEEMIAEMRLQWWADAIGEIYDGKPIRQHEVVIPLAHIINEHNLPRDLFDGLIVARRFDIYRDPHDDRAAFDDYIEATSSNLMEMAARTLDSDAPISIRDVGYANGVANMLRALPALYSAHKDPVPVEGPLDRNAVIGCEVPANLAQAVSEIAAEGLARLNVAKSLPKALRPAILPAFQARALLRQVRTSPETLLAIPPSLSDFRKSRALLWSVITGRL